MIGLAMMLAMQSDTLLRPGTVHMLGNGTVSCATASQPENASNSLQWALGFWSGLNAANGKSIGGATDAAGIEAEVRKQCAEEPSMYFVDAITRAYMLMAKRTT